MTRGIFDAFQDTMQNPLFLGGASLLSGDGMDGALRGMQAGNQFAMQRQKQAELAQRRTAFEQLLADPSKLGNIPMGAVNLVRAAGSESGFGVLAGMMPKPKDATDEAYKIAQINKLNREAANGGEMPSNVREWQYFNKLGPEDQQRYMNMKRAEKYLDIGTGFVRPNPAQPGAAPQHVIQKDIVGKEAQEAIGKAQGEGVSNWGKAAAAYQQFENKTTLLNETIDRAVGRISPWTTGVGGAVFRNMPATEARALQGDLDTIKANLGFKELETMRLNSPTGAALGAVSDVENKLLQSTQASIDQLMRGENLSQNLGVIKRNLGELARIQATKFQADAAKFAGRQQQMMQPPQPAPSGVWSIERAR